MRILYAILAVFTTIGFVNMIIKFEENINMSQISEYPSDIFAIVLLGVITFLLLYYSSKPKKDKVKKSKDKISDLSLLSNISWIIESTNDVHEVWIFRKNDELIISRNGLVETGNWTYFIESKSLFIEIRNEKKLYSIILIDETNISIKLEGTDKIISFIRKINQGDKKDETNSNNS